MKFRVLSVIASYYVHSLICLWRSLDVSSLGPICRRLHVIPQELLRVFTKFDVGKFHEKFLRHCNFTAAQIGLQWILPEPYNKSLEHEVYQFILRVRMLIKLWL